ncbi:MAG: MerR family transcriptional regulator [Candidatus Marinimicrobia bacterium]|jgi:DNA-binding transcriptional MerR regulator|nr:MerR family transcriptional regulator [Candidatus Neomarinimicrobiota bacterium]|tara:strand:- start:306 stop:695 length:390 start_codon:yes stop_codon:yes gene_type:complete
MNMEARIIKKLYYSIGEVSEITGLKQYVLRYWETEFSQLRPSKNRAGNRTYKSHDLDLITEIQTLLYKRKFTIKGARQYLKDRHEDSVTSEKIVQITKSPNELDLKTLKNLRNGLNEIIKTIESYKKEI